MRNYEKARMVVVEDMSEGVYAASGVKTKCRFGRSEANPGSDTCQSCSKTNGLSSTEKAYKSDYHGCVDNMPEKKK